MSNFQTLYPVLIFILMTTPNASIAYYDDYFISDTDPDEMQRRKTVVSATNVETTERPTGYSCGLCIIVDEEFAAAYNINDPKILKNTIQKFVDHANWIFRNVDWNSNGRPDNIGFRITKISYGWKPYKHETPKHYEDPKPALQLLKIFARLNFTKCCLGVGFTNRPFSNGLDGISFVASDRLLGGICDHRNPHEESMTNMNVVLISGKGLKNSQLTSYQVAKSLLHELGHAFGAYSHDNDYTNRKCWGLSDDESTKAVPVNGRYIMWEKSSQNEGQLSLKRNTLRFSACSKTAISNILDKRKNRQKCFELDYNPFCGNGIVEGMEMCDCGNEYDCSQDKCCGSRKSESACILDSKCKPVRALPLISSAAGKPRIWLVFVTVWMSKINFSLIF